MEFKKPQNRRTQSWQIFSREKKKQQKIETKGLEYLHKSFLFCTTEKKLFLSNNNKTTCPKKRVNDTNSCWQSGDDT